MCMALALYNLLGLGSLVYFAKSCAPWLTKGLIHFKGIVSIYKGHFLIKQIHFFGCF